MSFAQRNGEEEQPTEPGWYWFKGVHRLFDEDGERTDLTGPTEGMVYFHVEQAPLYLMDTVSTKRLFSWNYQGQWWGPVTPPWEQGE